MQTPAAPKSAPASRVATSRMYSITSNSHSERRGYWRCDGLPSTIDASLVLLPNTIMVHHHRRHILLRTRNSRFDMQ
jgi:hypothetical protein